MQYAFVAKPEFNPTISTAESVNTFLPELSTAEM